MTGDVCYPHLLPGRPVTWRALLAVGLFVNAGLVLGYRVYRLSRGGPMADAIGGAILAALVTICGLFVATGSGWPRWPALLYALLFAVLVMPIWTLSVLIPLPPGRVDLAFTVLYWASLVLIGAGAVAL